VQCPLVSIVVRSMARPSVAATLHSISAQNYPNIEVIMVAAAGVGHPVPDDRCGVHPLRFVASPVPLGRPAAANAGLDAANGEWITFLDDDDVFLAGHVAGMMAAREAAPDAEVIHCWARAVFRDGRTERFGQPFSLMQLYERNFMHLSCAIFARALVQAGCRCDESLPIHEDWDFFLQIAQTAKFHFVPRDTFQWNADAGASGAGGGANQDDRGFARYRDIIYGKWAAARDALVNRVEPMLRDAAGRAARGDYATAGALCKEVLVSSPNDPWALNLLASVLRVTGRGQEARRIQSLAVAVCPQDPVMVTNLAMLCRADGDMELARRCCDQALALAPDYTPARRLRVELAV
jgi:glycosyltransferase involved in cell wall biosynthesis